MSYNDKEISTQDGKAAALYRLDWGLTHWFYTSADRAITRMEEVDNETIEVTYEPRAVQDNGMVQGSSSQNDFQLDGPSDLPIVRLFRGSPPSETIWLTVRRIHAGEDDAPIYWKGTVKNLKRPKDATCSIIGAPLSASLKRTGLRLCWTRECPHFLYGPGCFVEPSAYLSEGAVAAIDGVTITATLVTPKDEGWFAGGFLTWQASDDGTIERRMIENDSFDEDTGQTTFTIFGLVDFLALGDTIKAYPGCTRTPDVCTDKFDNLPNYGGFDKMPGASPFNTAIW